MSNCENSGPGPLFETPITRVLDAAPPAIANLLRQFLDDPLRDVSELRNDINSYLQKLSDINEESEFLDLALARRVAAQCVALLDGLGPDSSQEAQQLVQVAVSYFVKDDDAEGDTDSLIGFDDDAEVVELVAREIGREDVLDIDAPEGG